MPANKKDQPRTSSVTTRAKRDSNTPKKAVGVKKESKPKGSTSKTKTMPAPNKSPISARAAREEAK